MAIVIDVPDLGGYISETITFSFNTTSAVASGGFIVLGVAYFSSTETLNSVNGGSLTWTIDKKADDIGASSVCVAIVSAQAPTGLASGTTITTVFSAIPAIATAKATSFTGVATSSPVDGTPTGPTTNTENWETASYAIAAGSVITAICELQANSTNTPTAPSVEAWDAAMGTHNACVEYRIEASAGSYQVAGAWGTAATTNNIAVAYLSAVAPAGPPPRGIMTSRGTSW